MPFRGIESGSNFDDTRRTQERIKKLEQELDTIKDSLAQWISIYKQAIDDGDSVFAEEQKEFIYQKCGYFFMNIFNKGLLVYEGSADNFFSSFFIKLGKLIEKSFFDVTGNQTELDQRYDALNFFLELGLYLSTCFKKEFPFDIHYLPGTLNEYMKISKN